MTIKSANEMGVSSPDDIEFIPTTVLEETLALARKDVATYFAQLSQKKSPDESRAAFQKWSAARLMRNTILDELDRREAKR